MLDGGMGREVATADVPDSEMAKACWMKGCW